MTQLFTFEHLRATLDNLEPPPRTEDRSIYWIFNRKLGLAKTNAGKIEIFLVGECLYPKSKILRRHLEYGNWSIAESSQILNATRIILPPAQHFLSMATLIAIEFIRAKINENRLLQDVLTDVEPFLELCLRKSSLDDNYVVGLIGELLCLEVLLDSAAKNPEKRSLILDMWQGHQLGRRDFTIGEMGVEVKTTYLETSTHKITGLHQIELNQFSKKSEKQLFLLSIGLTPSEIDGQTLPEIVQRILNKLGNNLFNEDDAFLKPLQRRFLDDVAKYGAGDSVGYDHFAMKGSMAYSTKYRNTFTPRLYDILDTDIRILRSKDMAGKHIRVNDIQYRMDLPSCVNGLNPSQNWRHFLIETAKKFI